MLDMFRGASITLPAVTAALNFRAPQPPQPRQPNQNLRIRPLSSPTKITSFAFTKADSASFSSVLSIYSAAAAAAAANLYTSPLPNQAAASLTAVQIKASLLQNKYNNVPQFFIDRTVRTIPEKNDRRDQLYRYYSITRPYRCGLIN